MNRMSDINLFHAAGASEVFLPFEVMFFCEEHFSSFPGHRIRSVNNTCRPLDCIHLVVCLKAAQVFNQQSGSSFGM
jgi:hypothetical protein